MAKGREFETPWRAKGAKVLSADDRIVAKCATPEIARCMAQSRRSLAILRTLADAYPNGWARVLVTFTHNATFWGDVCQTLERADKGEWLDRDAVMAIALALDADTETATEGNGDA